MDDNEAAGKAVAVGMGALLGSDTQECHYLNFFSPQL
jgi:hypothetical protein